MRAKRGHHDCLSLTHPFSVSTLVRFAARAAMHRRSIVAEKESSIETEGSAGTAAPLLAHTERPSTGTPARLLAVTTILLVAASGWLWLPQYILASANTSNILAAAHGRVFSAADLAQFDASNPALPIYLAVLGEVFDVTEGRRFYAPPSHYSYFSGRDGSRAFATGEFTDATGRAGHDLADLLDAQLITIDDWRKSYHEKYTFLGRLYQSDGSGFYDAQGQATQRLTDIHGRLGAARALASQQAEYLKNVPGCNSYFRQGEGGRIWCDGGLLPRKVGLRRA